MPNHQLQQFGLAVIIGGPILASCVVGLRVYARRKFGIRLGWDDYTIIIATILSIFLAVPSTRFLLIWHMGYHIWEVPLWDQEPDFRENWRLMLGYNLLNTLILPLVKVSIIILLLKIAWILTSIRRALYVILAFVVLACLGPWCAQVFLCPQLTAGTTGISVYPGIGCIDRSGAGKIMIFLASVNMFTDIVILPIPILLMRGLNTTWKARIAVIVSFSLVLGATVIGAVRLERSYRSQLDYRVTDVSDWTYNIDYVLQHAENNLAIMLSCASTLRSLMMGWVGGSDEESRLPGESTVRRRKIPGESLLFMTMRARDADGDEEMKHGIRRDERRDEIEDDKKDERQDERQDERASARTGSITLNETGEEMGEEQEDSERRRAEKEFEREIPIEPSRLAV